ncbi:MAG: glycosyltransferase family 9 protein [Mucispirillum sp.]|nr:glycosyltransferase family 9 protein [Mucispirillum sp.]
MFIFCQEKIKTPKNIIIARTDKIGDLVLSIPAISMVKKMYPESKLYVLVRRYNAEIIKGFPFIDGVISIDDYNAEQLNSKIRQIHADVFIALYSNSQILKLALKSGAKYRIGPLSKPFSWFVYNKGIRQHRSKSVKNEAEYNLDLVRHIDKELFASLEITIDKIPYGKLNHNKIVSFLDANNIYNYVVVHPFSGGSTKNFQVNEYIKLINKIHEKWPDKQIVISSSVQDIEDAEYISQHCSNTYVYTAKSILELAALIDKCRLYIGASTGPSHIAGNLNKKCLCIYPAYKFLSHTRWGLYGNDANTTYIVPDANNVEKDYKSKVFSNITDDIINEAAEKALEKLYGGS